MEAYIYTYVNKITKKKLSEARKGKPLPKCKWLKPDGEIAYMDKGNGCKHKDWKLLEE